MAVEGEGSLFFKTGLDNTGLQKDSKATVGIIQGMSKTISKINPFAALAVTAVASMAIISKAAIDMAREFETAMAEVQTISNVSEGNFKDIAKSVFALSKVSVDKPAALANAYYQLVSAGFDGAKGLTLLAISSKAAVAGITETETAADGLTTVLNAFKLEATDAEHVADIFFNTVKLGKTTFGELATNMSTVAPIAAASGISFEEVAGAIATLTKSGVPTAQAMTQIRSAIIGTNEALGDGWTETMNLVEAFQFLYDKAGGSQTELQGLVGRIEAVSGILGVAGINAASATADFESMGNVVGATGKAFDIMINTNENQWKLFGNNIRSTIIGIGDSLLGMSSGIARGLNSLFRENESVVASLKKHRTAIIDLTFEYKDTNTTVKRRIEILGELKRLNPAIVSGLGTEEDAYVLLTDKLKAYNDFLNTRIRLEKELTALEELKDRESALQARIIDVEFRAGRIVKTLYASVLKGSLKLSDEGQAEFNKIIEKNFDTNIEKIRELGRVITKFGNAQADTVFGFVVRNFPLSAAENDLKLYQKRVNKTLGDIDIKQGEINEKLLLEIKFSSTMKAIVLDLLKTYEDLDRVSRQIGVDVSLIDEEEIAKEVAILKAVAIEIANINKITKTDFKQNPDILAKYLESENERIAEAAEKRKGFLEAKGFGGGKDEPDDKSFEKQLAKQRDAYEAYNLALKAGDDKLAQEIKESYDLKHEQYVHYLQGLFKVTEDFEDKIIILKELKDTGGELRQVLTPIDTIHLKVGAVEIDPDYTKSLKDLENELQALQDKHYKSNNDAERAALAEKIKIKSEEIDVVRGIVKEQAALYEDLNRTIAGLSRKELKDRLNALQKALDKELAMEIKNIKAINKLRGLIDETNRSIGDKLQDTIADIVGVLNEASSLFSKFGNEDMAQLLGQLAGVAEGVGGIAAGISTGNPLAVIEGSLKVLNSAITIEIESDTAKFEKEIERLSIVLKELGRDIAAAIGIEKIDTRIDQLREEGELLEANRKALQAELEARKVVKFLGIKVGDKGKGSGTDTEAVKDFEDAIDELEHRLVQLQLEIYETLTGATATSITDSIIKGFADGKSSIEDFAGTFEDLMKKAIIETFKLKYLEQATQDFFELFGTLAESDGALTAEEIAILRANFADLIATSEAELAALNDILSSAGIDGGLFSTSAEADGLAGQIRREITEETGTILAGLMRRVADDVSLGLAVSREAVENLVLIQTNTFNTVAELQQVVIRLDSIEDNTRQSLLHDLGG